MDDRLAALDAWLRARCTAPTSAASPPPPTRASGAISASSRDGRTFIAMDAPPRARGLPALRPRRGAAARRGPERARGPRTRTSRRASCCSPTSGAQTYLQALRRGATPTRLFRDAIAALVRWQAASREGVLPALRRGAAAPRARPLSRVVRRAPPRASTLDGRRARRARRRVPRDPRQQPRPAARLRAPRLHAAQPHGERAQPRHPRLPGRGARARSATTSPRSFATRSSAGRRSACSTAPSATGSARARRGCRCAPTSPSSGATSSGWACSAT